MGILAHAFPPSRARSLAFATFAAGAPVGAVFGNIMGGVLTERTAYVFRSCLGFSFDRDLDQEQLGDQPCTYLLASMSSASLGALLPSIKMFQIW